MGFSSVTVFPWMLNIATRDDTIRLSSTVGVIGLPFSAISDQYEASSFVAVEITDSSRLGFGAATTASFANRSPLLMDRAVWGGGGGAFSSAVGDNCFVADPLRARALDIDFMNSRAPGERFRGDLALCGIRQGFTTH